MGAHSTVEVGVSGGALACQALRPVPPLGQAGRGPSQELLVSAPVVIVLAMIQDSSPRLSSGWGVLWAVAPHEAQRFCCGSASIRALPGQPLTCLAQTTPCPDAGPWKGLTELCFLVSTAAVWLRHRNGERVCAARRCPFPWRLSLQLPLGKLL